MSRTKDLAENIVDRAKDWSERAPQVKDVTRKGVDRVRGLDLAGMVPEPVKDFAAEKTGRKRQEQTPEGAAETRGHGWGLLVWGAGVR